MSAIVIDGYNLIGVDHHDLAAQRDTLIRLLARYGKTKGHDITVVFDGWKSGGLREEMTGAGGIRIIYSRLGEKADSVIKRIVSDGKKAGDKELLVISSDRDIASHAWACGSVPVPSAEFLARIGKPEGAAVWEYELLEEDDGPPERRGNARTLSKKEKTVRRALKKL